MKKIIRASAVFALICMLLFLCTACGNGGSSDEEASEPTCTMVVETNKTEATFTITDSKGAIFTGQSKSATFSGVATGNMSISYGPIDGYCTPGFEARTAGAGNTVKFTAEYRQGCDSNIIIKTNRGDAGFLLIGPETYYGNGTHWEMLGVPDGSYTIIFNDLAETCYITPSTETRTAVAGSVLTLDVEYESDPDCVPGSSAWYKDEDGDGFSDGTKEIATDRPNSGYYGASKLISTSGDCDDNDNSVHPGATEICDDGKDNDCDGDMNEDCTTCTDGDSDGYYAESGCGTEEDCDDSDETVYPGALELCDGIDNQCPGDAGYGDIDEGCTTCTDADSDGYYVESGCGTEEDCDDTDARIHPGATETCGDGVDQNCDGHDCDAPVADAGPDRFIDAAGVTVTLDGTGSSASTGAITYDWRFVSIPSGSNASLDNPAQANPAFTADICGAYLVELIVNDGHRDSTPDSVRVTACNTGIFSYDFESGWDDWYADNGIWEVGTPTSGPNEAYSNPTCAGTVLDGDYPETDSRLVSHSIQLPAIGAGEEIHLRFWHWFSFASDDAGRVQVSEETVPGEWSDWVSLDSYTGSSGEVWTYPLVDLSGYAGGKVRIGFLLDDDYYPGSYVGLGWYVDDVSITLGETTVLNSGDTYTCGFEEGIGDWWVHNGAWQVGMPTSGPGGTHSGANVAGTVLDGDYSNTDSRLVSPSIQLPSIGAGEEIHLRFWHWFSFASADAGRIQVSEEISPGVWSTWYPDPVSGDYTGSCGGVWTPGQGYLSAYAGKKVRIGFLLDDNHYPGSYVGLGWYVDDVLIETP
ncbi:MAG: hypothetical protein BA865_06000 [Desulfobacterales bacterium S5133MH4]|nr:MAG: hypothetical protein BA865_06000 [Desulfobacterales bacterium S5133MH4]